MPKTAAPFFNIDPHALTADLIKQIQDRLKPIETGTRVASQIIKDNINAWTNKQTGEINVKMVIASYNAGLPRMQGNANTKADQIEKLKKQGNATYVQLSTEQIRRYSEDFWKLVEFHMVPEVTVHYVPEVLGAIFAGARPDQAKISSDTSLAFTDLN
jgi:hypothetical protein